jgi:hypothetical protein
VHVPEEFEKKKSHAGGYTSSVYDRKVEKQE